MLKDLSGIGLNIIVLCTGLLVWQMIRFQSSIQMVRAVLYLIVIWLRSILPMSFSFTSWHWDDTMIAQYQ